MVPRSHICPFLPGPLQHCLGNEHTISKVPLPSRAFQVYQMLTKILKIFLREHLGANQRNALHFRGNRSTCPTTNSPHLNMVKSEVGRVGKWGELTKTHFRQPSHGWHIAISDRTHENKKSRYTI